MFVRTFLGGGVPIIRDVVTKNYTVISPKKMTGKKHCTHTQHTTQRKKTSRCLPTPSGFALSPWQHLPWPQIMVPRLPTSLLQAPGGGFALAAAGSLLMLTH